jgi:hypothetical protein
MISIGNYHSEIEAALAYDEKATEFFGEHARLNRQLFPLAFRLLKAAIPGE